MLVKKLLLVPVLLAFACAFAGAYGALHNQISFTVSPEYFTKFKFHQFGIDGIVDGREGAAIVGWLASWWMGIVIGIVLIPMGLMLLKKDYFWSLIRVYWIVAATTFLVGMAALGIAFLVVDADMVDQFSRYNNEIVDDAAFIRAGTMHNFSYIGGLAGILTGAISILIMRTKGKTSSES